MIELRVKIEISFYKVGDFNTPFLVIHRTTRLKSVSTDNIWKTTNNQIDLIGNCRPFDPITTEQHPFPVNMKHYNIGCVLCHETNLNKFKGKKNKESMFSNHSEVKLKTSNRKIFGKSTNTWELNNTFLNNSLLWEEVSKILENMLKLIKIKNKTKYPCCQKR